MVVIHLNYRNEAKMFAKHDLTGQKFGKLTVLNYYGKSKFKHLEWLCKCDCGNEKITTGNFLRTGHTNTCGLCQRPCGNLSPRWEGAGELSAVFFRNIWSGANQRGLEFDITKEEIWELFLKQDRKCALTSEPLRFSTLAKPSDNDRSTASLDRIDNSKGYILDNVWWVHKDANRIKYTLDIDDLFYISYLTANKSIENTILETEDDFGGYKLISKSFWNSIKNSAEKRSIDFNLSIEEAWNVFANQNGKCFFTGMDISLLRYKQRDKKFHTASLDRIDSSLGYHRDNIVWAHKTVNRIKYRYSNERFTQILKEIYETHKEKVTENLIERCKPIWEPSLILP